MLIGINLIFLLILGLKHLTINSSTEWSPEWDIVYFQWFMTTFIITIILNAILMTRVYLELANPVSKKVWIGCIIGSIGASIALMGIAFANILPYDSPHRIFGNLLTATVLLFAYIAYRALNRFEN